MTVGSGRGREEQDGGEGGASRKLITGAGFVGPFRAAIVGNRAPPPGMLVLRRGTCQSGCRWARARRTPWRALVACAGGGRARGVGDTIYAVASDAGAVVSRPAGVAVLRISGAAAEGCLRALMGPRQCMPQPRYAALRTLYDDMDTDVLDEALVLWMPGPHSFTGENVAELHLHGSRAVVSAVMARLSRFGNGQSEGHSQAGVQAGVRVAEPGEFTRRAYENGRLNLTEVEGLADLLSADTAAQRAQALRQLQGHTHRAYMAWREGVKTCLAHTEAIIDFGDDDHELDVQEDDTLPGLRAQVAALRDAMHEQLAGGKRGELVRTGVRLAIAGAPNAGKSSLLNLLANRPAAIVSPVAGTTRDVIDVHLDLDGIPVVVSDSAGIRDRSADPVEAEGIKRARSAVEEAHVQVLVADVTDRQSVQAALSLLHSLRRCPHPNALLVLNKTDMLQADAAANGTAAAAAPAVEEILEPVRAICEPRISVCKLSCTTGTGLEAVLQTIKQLIEERVFASEAEAGSGAPGGGGGGGGGGDGVLVTRERHRQHLGAAAVALDRFLAVCQPGGPLELAAEELRIAMTELGLVTGDVHTEEILDVVFRDFCIGK